MFVFIFTEASFAWSDWQCLKTDHFKVCYKTGHELEARQVLETLEYYRPQVEKLCGNEIFDYPVVLDETGIMVNGFTDPVNSYAHLFLHSPGAWAGTENWWSLVGVHEYTHELSLSHTSRVPGVLTSIFGNSMYFMPNMLIPGWISEGITVYSESQLTPYQGRLNDGVFDAYIGARVADGRLPSILEATYLDSEYPFGEGQYNYGGEFFNYLAQTYGEDKFAQFFAENGSVLNFLFFPAINIDRSAKIVYGKSFPELWEEWREYEKNRFKDFQMEGRQVTETRGSVANPQVHGNKLFYQQSYYRKTGAFKGFYFGNLIERDLATGKERKTVTNTEFATPYKVRNGKLYYTSMSLKTHYGNSSFRSYGAYASLQKIDLKTSKEKTLLKEEIRSFAVLDDGKIIYSKDRKSGFGSEIYLKEPGVKKPKLLHQTEYLVEELEASNDRVVAVARKDWETLSIYNFDLKTGQFTSLIHTPYLEYGISLQNDKLFFSANYQKIHSSFCYDFTTAQIHRLTEKGLAINPTYDEANNKLYYVGINSKGYDIYCQEAVFKEFELPDCPATVPPVMTLSDNQISQGGYGTNLKSLVPRFWLPLIISDEDKYGLYFEGGDDIMDFPWYACTIGYNTKEKKYFGTLDMEMNYFAPFHTAISYDDEDERTAKLTMDYPLFSFIDIGVSLGLDPDYDGVEIEPFIGIGDFFRVSAPRSKLKNGKEREALYGQLKYRQYLPGNNELEIQAKYIDDIDNPDTVFTEIRGYEDELEAKKGKIYTLEYSRPLWKIRKGLWNPNVFFEDLTLSLFTDRAEPESGPKQESWGLEFHLETKMAYMIPLDWGCRYVRNDNDESTIELFIKSIFGEE